MNSTTQWVLFGGGAGGGKSWLGVEWLVLLSIQYPGIKSFIGRNELTRIMSSTYITFQKVCKYHNIPREAWKLDGKYNVINFWNGSKIDLIDVAYKPSDPLYERFGSIEYTVGWLEEVGEIKGKAFDVLKSRIGRHMNKEYNIFPKMFLTCNPKKNWVYFDFYQPWKKGVLPEDTAFIQSLYNDNPYTSEEYGKLLSKIKDKVLRNRLKNGDWEYEDNDANMMEYEKILDIFTTPFDADKHNGAFYISCDVARSGRDKAVIILWQGYFIRKIWFYDTCNMPFLENKIDSKAAQYHAQRENIVIDQDGVGGGVVDHLPGAYAFVNAGRAVQEFDDDPRYRQQQTIKYSYTNLRAQCYHKLALLVNAGKIGCYAEIEPEVRNFLIQELEAIKKKDVENNERKFQVISKEEIKETIGRSPDFADSLMMRCVFGLGMPAGNEEAGASVAW